MFRVQYGGLVFFFFFKQKTAYEMRISDWSSDVCSSDLYQCRQRLAPPIGMYTLCEQIIQRFLTVLADVQWVADPAFHESAAGKRDIAGIVFHQQDGSDCHGWLSRVKWKVAP